MSKFGDIIGLDLPNCTIVDTNQKSTSVYKLALFTAFDSNCRILLVGFGLYSNCNVADMFRMLKFFFKLQKKPQGFVTSQEPAVIRTFNILQEIDAYKGLHSFDKIHVLEDLQMHG